jgi:hypothetical protein
MAPFSSWTELPHGKLTALEDNLLTVVGELTTPGGESARRMTVVRLKDGRLVLYSAVALDEPEIAELVRFGTPAFLVVPSHFHRKAAKFWKERFAALRVIAPDGARAKTEKVVDVDASHVDFQDASVRYVTVPGVEGYEAALIVETPRGTTLVVSDLVGHANAPASFGGWLSRKLKFRDGQPSVMGIVRVGKVRDRGAVRAQLNAWTRLRNLHRIVVSNGDIIDRDPVKVLRELAQSLAAS